jgi:hypothetical protein
MNIHAEAGDDSQNIVFENITAYRSGYLGKNVQGGGYGDGVSFHENCTGIGRNLNLTENYKSGIVDINGANTNDSDIYLENNEDYGIYFTGELWSNQYHFLSNIVAKDNPYCLRTVSNLSLDNLNCISNDGGQFGSYHQVAIELGTTNITNFNISGTNSSFNSVYVSNARLFLVNGKFDKILAWLVHLKQI